MTKKKKKKKNNYFEIILIFFDDDELEENLKKIIKNNNDVQIFIIIISSNKEAKKKLEFMNQLDIDDLENIDMTNIQILENYKTIYLSLIKIYYYFNKLDDIEFDNNFGSFNFQSIEGLGEELKHLKMKRYFNILLCGEASSGKSTFINTIIGEKKALIGSDSGTTLKNNIYFHKKYPIRFIDNCGFDKGDEGHINSQLAELGRKNSNIFINNDISEIFGFCDDRKNDIHLILYFSIYNTHYNISKGYLEFIQQQKSKKIPIVFIISKCDKDKIFSDEEYRKKLKKTVISSRENQGFEECETVFINCLNKKGLKDLFEVIYNRFQIEKISNNDLEKLEKLKEGDFYEKELKLNNKLFFQNIDEEYIINEPMKLSVKEIKILITKLVGYYSDKFKFKVWARFLFTRLWNWWNKNNHNFFPLLCELIQKIYHNFGIDKNIDECNEYIKKCLYKYFNIDGQKNGANEGQIIDKLERDIINYRNLFWNTNKNFKLKEQIEQDLLVGTDNFIFNKSKSTNVGKIFLRKEKQIYSNKNNYINNIEIKIDEGLLLNEKENEEQQNKIIDLESNQSINTDTNPNKKLDILKEIQNYIKSCFGESEEDIKLKSQDLILIKIFLTNYVSNELTSELCKDKSTSKTIWDFYLESSKIYNEAIEGFNKIKEEFNLEN